MIKREKTPTFQEIFQVSSGEQGRKALSGSGGIWSEEGLTLAELLVFVGVMLLMLVGIANMIRSGAVSSSVTSALSRIEDGANEALETMVRSVRMCTSIDPSSTSGALVLWGDFLNTGKDVSMAYAAGDGWLKKGGSVQELNNWVEGVRSVTFSYYDYDSVTGSWVQLTPGTSGWNTRVERVDVDLNFQVRAGETNLERNFRATAARRNR